VTIKMKYLLCVAADCFLWETVGGSENSTVAGWLWSYVHAPLSPISIIWCWPKDS